MFKRDLTVHLKRLAKKFPVVAIVGPRQSGKTTLAKTTFSDYAYVSLELLEQREFALNDPKGFLQTYKNDVGLIIDEAQYVPSLFSYIQVEADEMQQNGYFILTGSQNFLLSEKITQSLAGRVAITTLLPLSIQELKQANILPNTIEDALFKGGYPRLFAQNISPVDLYPNYINTYIERDVRQIQNIINLSTFQRFLKLCAGRIGQLLNLSSLANDCGISVGTAKAWISILESSYIIYLLQPHYKNFSKRLIKTPKLYFYDTGVVCSLLELDSIQQVTAHYLRGGLFESFMITEILKYYYNSARRPYCYFWRDKIGHEIDCIIEKALEIIPIEIKAGQTIASSFFANLEYYNKIAATSADNNFLLYAGNQNQTRKQGQVLSWKHLEPLFIKISSEVS